MKFEVFDNLLPKDFSDEIENLFLTDLPWYYFDDVTYANTMLNSNEIEKSPGFNHEFYDVNINGVNSSYFGVVEKIPNFVFKKFSPIKIRAFLQIPPKNNKLHNNIHNDFAFDHMVLLYYVNDSDGDTFLFNDDDEIIARILPKKGRILLFNGKIKHASSQPKENKRIIINYGIKNDYER